MPAKYDVSEVTKQLLRNTLDGRAELMKEMSDNIRDCNEVKRLLIQVGKHAVEGGSTPLQLMQLGLMYGMVLGVYLEKERAARSRIIQ